MTFLLGGFEQATNSVDKNSRKSNLKENWITGNTYAGADSTKHELQRKVCGLRGTFNSQQLTLSRDRINMHYNNNV